MRKNITIGYRNSDEITKEKVKCVCLFFDTYDVVRAEVDVLSCDILVTPSGKSDGVINSTIKVVTPVEFISMIYRNPSDAFFTPEELIDGLFETCKRCVTSYSPIRHRLCDILSDSEDTIISESDSLIVSFKNGYNRHDFVISNSRGIVKRMVNIRPCMTVDILITNSEVLNPQHKTKYSYECIELMLGNSKTPISYSTYRDILYQLFVVKDITKHSVTVDGREIVLNILNTLNTIKSNLCGIIGNASITDEVQSLCKVLDEELNSCNERLVKFI